MITKWEYKVVAIPDGSNLSNIEDLLREPGEDGWELSKLGYGIIVFKRPINS